MSRCRLLFPLLLLAGLGCAPDGPVDFYRETLQARSEFADTLTFIVDEPSAVHHFPPAIEILRRRVEVTFKNFEDWNKKTEVPGGFEKLVSENYRPTSIGAERKADMAEALAAYESFCRNIVYVNARLNRENKRLQTVMQAELAKRAESGQRASASDLPGLSATITSMTELRRTTPPRIFNTSLTKVALDKFAKPGIDTEFVTKVDPGDFFVMDPNLNIQTAPPPAMPANVAAAIDKIAERIAKQPTQITGIVAVYRDEKPRMQSLKNETGKALRNVNGWLIVRENGQQTDRWIPVKIDEWRTADTKEMPVSAGDNPRQMRLLFEGLVEGDAEVGLDQRLPDPPPPKAK
jgi:hypothetical protein